MKNVIVIHGGAGRYSVSLKKDEDRITKFIEEVLKTGWEALINFGSLEAVYEVVSKMEESGLFNAGRGAVLNISGEVELDAAIMDGSREDFGAVGSLKGYWNAIKLARIVMEKTDHVFIVGDGASRLAEYAGLERFKEPLKKRIKQYNRLKSRMLKGKSAFWNKNIDIIKNLYGDTIGAIALDEKGHLASAVSTGGIWLKLPGRVGDSSIVGAGFYANNRGACVASGIGEIIARFMLCNKIINLINGGLDADEAAKKAIHKITDKYGTGNCGVIALDFHGNIGISFNTEMFIVGYIISGTLKSFILKNNDTTIRSLGFKNNY